MFQCTDISGCFAWYKASDIGTSNGGKVCYWQDASGSGNHMQVNSSIQASSLACPAYYVNQLNGYPVVRFDGANNVLAITGNQPFYFGNLTAPNLTSFMVYKTSSATANQVIYANDNGLASQTNPNCFIIGIDDFGNPSGWYFAWGANHFGLPNNKIDAGSAVITPINEWVLRNDRWKTISNFIFSKNGADTASGFTVSLSQNSSNMLKVGASIAGGSPVSFFNGDMAELVFYDRPLGDDENKQVQDYLRQKYDLPGTNLTPLFIWGAVDPTGLIYNDFTLFTSGNFTPATNSISLYTQAATLSTSGFKLFTSASTLITSGTPLYIAGTGVSAGFTLFTSASDIRTSGVPMFIMGTGVANYMPLYIASSLTSTSGVDMYISGSIGSITKSFSLYIGSATEMSSGTNLYIGSSTPINSGSTLYINAANTSNQTSTLYIPGSYEAGNIPLFIWGNSSANSGLNLYTVAADEWNNLIPLYTAGRQQINCFTQLHISGTTVPSMTGLIPLFINAPNTVGVLGSQFSSLPFYMYSDGAHVVMPLTLWNIESNAPSTANMPLYISGPITTGTVYKFSPLYLFNNTAVGGKFLKMWIRGDGMMAGASVYTGAMNLFLDVAPGSFNSAPLYTYGYSNPSLYASLYSFGVYTNSSGLPLYIQGYAPEISGGISAYMAAGGSTTAIVNMTISGKPETNTNSILYTHGY